MAAMKCQILTVEIDADEAVVGGILGRLMKDVMGDQPGRSLIRRETLHRALSGNAKTAPAPNAPASAQARTPEPAAPDRDESSLDRLDRELIAEQAAEAPTGRKGRKAWNKGRKMSPEARAKISAAMRERRAREKEAKEAKERAARAVEAAGPRPDREARAKHTTADTMPINGQRIAAGRATGFED